MSDQMVREVREEFRWVILRTSKTLTDRQVAARLAAEARKWAAEEGMRSGDWISGGATLSPSGDEHRCCYVFEPVQ